jgi:hypothetical protein
MFMVDAETGAGSYGCQSVSNIASRTFFARTGNTLGERDASFRGTSQIKRFAIRFRMEDHRSPAPLQMSFDHVTIGVQREVNYFSGYFPCDLHAPGIIRVQNCYATLTG